MTDPVPSKERFNDLSLLRASGFDDAADEIQRLKGNLGVVADSHQWLYREKQRLEATLRGISTCSTCEACRGAALRALGGEATEARAAQPEQCQPLLHLFQEQGKPCICGAVPWGQPSNTLLPGDVKRVDVGAAQPPRDGQ